MRLLPLALMATLTIAAAGPLIPAAEAQSRYRSDGPGPGYVTAESRYSGKTITAPVRRGPYGRLEVSLPGGTWIECRRSCRDTLRRETIDFWDSRDSGGAGGDGVGYLHFRF